MQNQDIKTITGTAIPEPFRHLHRPPSQLYVAGDDSLLLSGKRVGIVGARKYTPYGREVTTTIARELSRQGLVIVSGLALGVDSIAHRACLEVGGKTIAVLPSGLRNIYPATHAQLAREIITKDGALISEYPADFKPFKASFLERNRLIAALSDVLIITEAAINSGSLNTAGHALELGKPIMAVPGPITSAYSMGTNNLIKTGAHPLISTQDVLSILNIQTSATNEGYIPENEAEAAIMSCLKQSSCTTNDIITTIDIEPTVIQATLTVLEIRGVIQVHGGNWSLL